MINNFYKTKKEISKWLIDHEIKNYRLIADKDYKFLVNVYQNVSLRKKNLDFFPVKFNIIDGHFDCSDNNLTTLFGCPIEVKDSFFCSKNNLTNLDHAPIFVGYDFQCNGNSLITLKGCTAKIGNDFNCAQNKLTSLEYCPVKIGGSFTASLNFLQDLKGITPRIKGNLFLHENEINTLFFIPKIVKGEIRIEDNPIGVRIEKYLDLYMFHKIEIEKKLLSDNITPCSKNKTVTKISKI